MNDAEKEANEIISKHIHYPLDRGEISFDVWKSIAQALQKKQDEIERLKADATTIKEFNRSRAVNADFVRQAKLHEKEVSCLNMEIERLKEKLSTAEKASTGYKKACDQYQEENESLTKKLSEAEAWRREAEKGMGSDKWLPEEMAKMQEQINALTTRNKELEHIIYLGLVNGTVDYSRWKSEAVQALESSKDYEDFKKSEKAFLETISQQGDEIKELKREVVRWQNEFGVAGRKVTLLESKLAAAREALKGATETYIQLTDLIWKTHVQDHVTPLNPPESCTICKDLNTANLNIEIFKKALEELGEKP